MIDIALTIIRFISTAAVKQVLTTMLLVTLIAGGGAGFIYLVKHKRHTNMHSCPEGIMVGQLVEHRIGNQQGIVMSCDDEYLEVDIGAGDLINWPETNIIVE